MSNQTTHELMVIGTLVTGFYAIQPGSPERLSPVFCTRATASAWIQAQS